MTNSPNYLAAQNILKRAAGIDVTKATSEVKSYVDSGAERIGLKDAACIPNFAFAKYIDHTLLKPEASREEIIKLCTEAKEHRFASVCINPHYVKLCAAMLRQTDVKVCTVIGFPLGASSSRVKTYETQVACEDGATEIDMVINIGELRSKNYDVVEADIQAVVHAADAANAIVKVIIETCLLTDEEKVIASVLTKNAGADFVKTSTGFSKSGATPEDIALMRKAVGEGFGIKASGGVRDYSAAKKMVEFGATRIGASASVKILREAKCIDVPTVPAKGGSSY
jgi:deoxyribose-phosphate aldolase